jgi:site-specific recombinase XerD
MTGSNYTKTSIEGFAAYLKREAMSSTTIVSYTARVEHFLQWLEREQMKPQDAGKADVLLYMKHCQKAGASQRSIQHYVGCVKTYYDHLTKQEDVKTNPVHGIKVQGVKRKILYQILEPQELHALYHNYETEKSTRQNYTMEKLGRKMNKVIIGLLVYQGLKVEELDRLEVNDVKMREGKIEIAAGKKSNARTMQLESHQVMDVYEYMMQVRPQLIATLKVQTSKLFVNEGSRVRTDYLMQQLRKQNSKLKTVDQIRASVIVKWLRQYNLREVQYLAGHRYISSTEAYKQNEMEGLTEEVNQFHPLG